MSDEQNKKHYEIKVNGVKKTVDHEVLSYEEVVRLFVDPPIEGTIYAVSFEYAKDPEEGDLVAGQHVTIKEHTEFDVDDTGRS